MQPRLKACVARLSEVVSRASTAEEDLLPASSRPAVGPARGGRGAAGLRTSALHSFPARHFHQRFAECFAGRGVPLRPNGLSVLMIMISVDPESQTTGPPSRP